MLSCGTDGADGPTDAAGAVIDQNSWQKISLLNLNPGDYLDNNDAYSFFEKMDGLLKTGLTGTNVMDVVIVLMD